MGAPTRADAVAIQRQLDLTARSQRELNMISSIRLAPTVRLLNGVDMPQLGLGTWPMASLNGLGRADPNMKDADEFGH